MLLNLLNNNFKIILSLLFAGLIIINQTIAQRPNKNVQFRSNINLGVPDYANIWGYVDSLGNEYALSGHYKGLTIINVTNPDAPFIVKYIKGKYSVWREVKTWKHYAYVTTEGGGGLQIINLRSLPDTNGILVKQWQPFYLDDTLRSIHALHIENGYAYLYGSNIGNKGALIANLTDPWNPTVEGIVDYSYIHDGYVRNDTLYAGHIYDGFLRVWDCRNKSNPVLLGAIQTPWAFTHNTWLSDNGKTVYITDEVNGSACVAYDVSNLQDIVEISRVYSQNKNSQAPIHNTMVNNDYIFNSWYADGFTIVDGSRPTNLVNVGWFDTSPIIGGGFNGCWGVYPFLPSGNLLANDRQTGVWVLTPTLKRAAFFEGTVIDSACSRALSNAKIELFGPDTIETYTDAFGNFKCGTPDTGLYTAVISKQGFATKTISNIQLISQQVFNTTIKLGLINPIRTKIFVCDPLKNPISNVNIKITDSYNNVQNHITTEDPFQICGLNADNCTIQANKWGYLGYCQTVNLNNNIDTFYIILRKGYYDDFSFDNNWSVYGTATAGIWTRSVPILSGEHCNTLIKVVSDVEADCENVAYITGSESACNSTNNVDNGVTILKSPVMNLSDYKYPVLSFYRWFYTNGSITSANDTLKVLVSNGSETKTLLTIQKSSDSLSTWKREVIYLKDFISLTNNMQIVFSIEDKAPNHLLEAGIDLFMVDDTTRGVGFGNKEQYSNLLIYPNPAQKYAYIQNNSLQEQVFSVYNITGELIFSDKILPQKIYELNVNQWSKGIYFIRNSNANGVINFKFIVW
jgi:choice-of-anchor B domain-containing protein